MESEPDFFLSAAGENALLPAVIACWRIARLKNKSSDNVMLVDVEPVVNWRANGLPQDAVRSLVLSPKFTGVSLFPVSEWPCSVFVARILDDEVRESLKIEADQISVISWGSIFPTYALAAEHAARALGK